MDGGTDSTSGRIDSVVIRSPSKTQPEARPDAVLPEVVATCARFLADRAGHSDLESIRKDDRRVERAGVRGEQRDVVGVSELLLRDPVAVAQADVRRARDVVTHRPGSGHAGSVDA